MICDIADVYPTVRGFVSIRLKFVSGDNFDPEGFFLAFRVNDLHAIIRYVDGICFDIVAVVADYGQR